MTPTGFSEWVERLPDEQRARMRDHLKRQRRAQAAVKPHAEHRGAERHLRAVVDMTAAVPILQRTKLIPEDHPHPARTLARSLGQSSRFERMRTGVYRLVQRDAE